MEWWTILIFGSVVWWLWPKLFGDNPPRPVMPSTPSIWPASLDEIATPLRPVEQLDGSVLAFQAMGDVRHRLVLVGATEQEIAQLDSLAPILLRDPPSPEPETEV